MNYLIGKFENQVLGLCSSDPLLAPLSVSLTPSPQRADHLPPRAGILSIWVQEEVDG